MARCAVTGIQFAGGEAERAFRPMKRTGPRRRVERIRLSMPTGARAGANAVSLIDLSLRGGRIEHSAAIVVGSKVLLTFAFEGEPITVAATVVRSKLERFSDGRGLYESGVIFDDPGDSEARLHRIISGMVMRALEEQKSNARGDVPRYLQAMISGVDVGGEAEPLHAIERIRYARAQGYVRYSLKDNGRWTRSRSRSAEQPEEGFTVWAYEDAAALDTLCESYASGEQHVRSLIRLCAELSLYVDDSLPPQKYNP